MLRSLAGVLTCGLVILASAAISTRAAGLNPQLSAWLKAQKNIHTWSADFIQTRTLKSLAEPLTAKGHVWFSAPDRFRWVLGHPPQTIAIRQTNVLYVVYPRLKRAEKYPLAGATGRWQAILALLDAGFPRSQAALNAQYNILGFTNHDGSAEVTLQPKSSSARQMMRQLKIAFSTKDYSLRATELEFADGSTLRNDFTNAVLNPKLKESLFAPHLGPEYKVVEPLKQQQ